MKEEVIGEKELEEPPNTEADSQTAKKLKRTDTRKNNSWNNFRLNSVMQPCREFEDTNQLQLQTSSPSATAGKWTTNTGASSKSQKSPKQNTVGSEQCIQQLAVSSQIQDGGLSRKRKRSLVVSRQPKFNKQSHVRDTRDGPKATKSPVVVTPEDTYPDQTGANDSSDSEIETLECTDWIEDNFGDGLQTDGMELAKPDPIYDTATHSHLATFRRFFDLQFWHRVARETNTYYAQTYLQREMDARMEQWTEGGRKGLRPSRPTKEEFAAHLSKQEVSGADLEVFVGVLLYMLIVKLPTYRLYWEEGTHVEKIRAQMSRNKFNHIRSNIHFVNDAHGMKDNPLLKAKPLLERFQKSCEELPRPETMWIDDVVIPDEGKVSPSKKYYRAHPGESGCIRILTLRSPSGVIQDFSCYYGRKAAQATETNAAAMEVVKDLICCVPKNKFYTLLLGNKFTSVELLKWLKEEGFHAAGVLREKGLTGDAVQLLNAVQNKLQAVESGVAGITAKDGTVYVCRWAGNKGVTLASTHQNAYPLEESPNEEGSDSTTTIRPQCAVLFDLIAGAANDPMLTLSRHDIGNKQRRWYIKLFHWIIGAAVGNCWLLERQWQQETVGVELAEQNELTLIQYIVALANELMLVGKVPVSEKNVTGRLSITSKEKETSEKQKAAVPPKPSDAIRLDGVCHWPGFNKDTTMFVVTDRKTGKPIHREKTNQRRCAYAECPDKVKNPRTCVHCSKCGVYLCLYRNRNCFVEYHKAQVGNKRKIRSTMAYAVSDESSE